jgi:hypothetical protein
VRMTLFTLRGQQRAQFFSFPISLFSARAAHQHPLPCFVGPFFSALPRRAYTPAPSLRMHASSWRRAAASAAAASAAAAAAASAPLVSASAASPAWTREQVRQALNDRYLIARRMEKTGLRRIIMACGFFVGE